MKKQNKLDYYLSLPYRLEITPDPEEGGFVAEYPELPGCLTCADTMEELLPLIEDAKRSWITCALNNKLSVPEPVSEKFSGQFKLRMPKSLHKSLSKHAENEGISMNQYCVYLLSMNDAYHISAK